jgi:8-oxo-dGTP diphosphatase
MDIDKRLNEVSDCLYRVSVKAVIFKDKKILLVKEEEDNFWSLPGGGIDYGENVQEALSRELSEELGIDSGSADVNSGIFMINTGGIYNGIPKLNIIFKVKVNEEAIKPTKYVQKHGWFTIEELKELYLSPSTGKIKSALIDAINAS